MKSFNVDDKFKNPEFIREAIIKTCKSKKKKKKRKSKKYRLAQHILNSLDEYTEKILESIIAFEKVQQVRENGGKIDIETFRKAYKPRKCSPFYTHDNPSGKTRKITCAPLFPDQIVHQMVVMAMKPVLMKYMYRHSYGSIPKRGPHNGKKYIEKTINHHAVHDKAAIKYGAKTDIEKCYENVNHSILKRQLKKKFRGKLFMWLVSAIIDSYYDKIIDGEKTGIPVGYSPSHWFCNFYLTPLDYFIKQKCEITYYARYMDDKVFFDRNKKELHSVIRKVMRFLEGLGMKLKYNWQVFRFDYIDRFGKRRGRDIDFLGYRFFRDKIILRKRNSLTIKRQALKVGKKEKVAVYVARSFMSRLGQLRHCNSRNFWYKHVKPHINIKKIKEVIRVESRKYNQACAV